MSKTHIGTALPGTGRPVTDRGPGPLGGGAAVTGMLSWVAGVALLHGRAPTMPQVTAMAANPGHPSGTAATAISGRHHHGRADTGGLLF